VYICDWLPPDFGAVGQYSLMFARDMAAQGFHVTLAGLSSTGKRQRDEAVGRGSLREIRLAATTYEKTHMWRRLWWTLKTNTRMLVSLWTHLRLADTIVFTGSPPLFLHWIAPANVILRKRLLYRITDFHPECAIAERGESGVLLGLLYRLTVFWRRRIHQFEVLGEDQRARLLKIGVPAERIVLKRDPSPVKITPATRPLPRPGAANSSLLLLYSGNWGVAHDYQTFLDGYGRHHRQGRARFILWLNAVGSARRTVEAALTASALPYISGSPVPLDQLASLLVTADAHLITLSDAFVGFALPSKTYACVQSRRPVLFIGSKESDVHALCQSGLGSAYVRVPVGDGEACGEALDSLAERIDRQLVDGRPLSLASVGDP
jgi:hypothetical protein